ncbi:serine/threonine protein kinase [Nostoc linckia z18]|uniref:non-specific serine/threonine protein kinase n=2 Tax=Nostoc linckia TaxID=92942 RepID=A0A9Q6ELU1_NOSLI|nr:serine/threonine-protein kinase [Nostoc linckia]PHJ66234.1 serine/threonine protein kinase [Nostoc linckia z1]PHJ71602.1 serine/threonine protein kinase [Nostoc linckia z3]PHJ90502.1 serine/threonine protein kinase [Nostoc linckia z6]PHK04731.1 serine/threonine protein kinase [Nostoc linckia z8]PHK17904.1 serine/threonine protein kinase [Nostoc linckia z14]PHK28383.1 serine/threonine protein kinase [Nostoc linckia z15]PHK46524.1 serine/threonine protein kinase [Nostoc linckia z16]
MSLCINPVCPKPNHPNNHQNRFCQSCGSHLELLGRYRVESLLSDKTGFSKVYEVYEQNTPKILKILREDLSSNPEAVELFQHEFTVLLKLNHPGIPQEDSYFQYQTRNGLVLHCIAMEKIDGYNLEEWFYQHNKPISQEKAIAYLKQLIEILDLVHGKQYLHRDIKPSNIMIKPDGQLVIIDFGTANEIAKNSLDESPKMTALMSSGYSAPEQMNGEAVPQSDFFALGRTFVFLLTGKHPLDMYDVQHNVLRWKNYTLDISPLLLDLIDWLIAPDIEKRPTNAQEIWQRLAEIETKLTTNHVSHIDVVKNLEPERSLAITPNFSHANNYLEKLPLLGIFASLLIVLGLLSAVVIATQTSTNSSPQNYGQLPEKKGNIDYYPYREGKDNQGRIAKFNIAVLSLQYKWVVGSNFQIQYNDQIISLNLLKLNLEQQAIQNIMEEPSEIISVGTTSCKGNIESQERLALERSLQIQLLVKKIFINQPNIKGYRLLNLGQFQRTDCPGNQDLTTYQRSIIVIGVKKQSSSVNLDEALRDRLEKKPFADFKLQDYSLGTADKFKTTPNNL